MSPPKRSGLSPEEIETVCRLYVGGERMQEIAGFLTAASGRSVLREHVSVALREAGVTIRGGGGRNPTAPAPPDSPITLSLRRQREWDVVMLPGWRHD